MLNKKSKKVLLSGIVVTSLAVFLGGCSSQPSYSDEKDKMMGDHLRYSSPVARADFLTSAMTEKLKLSQLQRNQVSLINLDYANRVSLLVNSNNPTINKRAEFGKLMIGKEAKFGKILDNAQMTAYKSFKAELKEVYRTM